MSILPVITAAVLLAQAQPSQPAAEKKDPNAPVTLNGCVQRDYTDSKNANAYTFIDDTSGSRYRLAGKNVGVSKYSGMSVQVVGIVDTKKLRVVGGFYPSTNVAAQAGSIDVGQAAVAALPGSAATTGVGNVELPILNVTRLSLGQGECRK